MSAQITFCPPAPQTTFFDAHHFEGNFQVRPVSVRYMGRDEWTGTGLDFGSYAFMQTSRRRQNKGRRFRTPPWTANDHDVQAVIVTYLESRVFSRKKQIRMCSQRLSLKTRLRRAEEALQARAVTQEVVVDGLCAEYVQSTDAARRSLLESEIQGLDTQIRINRDPAKVVAGVIYFYYREGLESTQVAAELGFLSPWVRQLLYRIMKIAMGLGLESPESITCQRRDIAEERVKRDVEKQATRDAERAARIAAREEHKAQRDQEKAERHAEMVAVPEHLAAKVTVPKPPRVKLEPTRVRWRREGKCVGCGKEKPSKKVYCETCLAQQRAYNKRRARQAGCVTAPADA